MKNKSEGIQIITGIESEALRIENNGALSTTPHPFDSNDTHFTKDFSESQLEIITDPNPDITGTVSQVMKLYNDAHSFLGSESLWPFSMPPELPADSEIPIAQFDNTEKGRWEHMYRTGLANRYGKKKQMISGVHLNISFSEKSINELYKTSNLQFREFVNGLYLNGARHLYEAMPMLIFLSGATPVADKSFPLSETLTESIISIRTSRSGYTDFLPKSMIDLSSVRSYIETLKEGLSRTHPYFRQLRLVNKGEIVQISDKIFQSEKEYYAPIRLRARKDSSMTEIQALEKYGIRYLELRFIDKDPYYDAGVNPDILRLAHLLLLQSLYIKADKNTARHIHKASQISELPLSDIISNTRFTEKQIFIFENALYSLLPVARNMKDTAYENTVRKYINFLHNPLQLPSVRLYQQFSESGLSWTDFGMEFSRNQRPERLKMEAAYAV